MIQPLRRIGGGREADILDLGDGTVLRRYHGVGHPEREALVMEHARRQGFPAPRVVEVRDNELVVERLEGPTMARVLLGRPWRARRYGALLAQLQQRLHLIAAPAELAPAGPGSALLHLDFHPENVLMTRAGPVVIDWTNARRGDPPLDVALSWVILATSGGPAGRVFAPLYLRHFDRETIVRALPAAAERRLGDPNVSDRERAAVRRLVDREAQ